MRFNKVLAVVASVIIPGCSSLNILLNNDDSWASANIREFYRLLKAAGHKVLLVAPAVNQSGKGGTVVFAESNKLTGPAEFNTAPAGAPAYGSLANDSNIWYYNGTPAATTFFALDYVIPRFWNNTPIDLFVSGPNEGNNLGPFLYTLSGTIGATYAAVERGIPGIAFSAGNGTHRSYTTVSGANDVATLNAQAAVKIVNQLVGKGTNGRILPLGYGINVNLPVLNSTCNVPNYIQSRLTGGAIIDKAVLNENTGVFTYGNDVDAGLNTCINGDCSLPGETNVVLGCSVSVSIFTTDYDAPTCSGTTNIRSLLQPLVVYQNSTSTSSNSTSSSGSTSGSSNSTSSASASRTSSIGSASGTPSGTPTTTLVTATRNAAPKHLAQSLTSLVGAMALAVVIA